MPRLTGFPLKETDCSEEGQILTNAPCLNTMATALGSCQHKVCLSCHAAFELYVNSWSRSLFSGATAAHHQPKGSSTHCLHTHTCAICTIPKVLAPPIQATSCTCLQEAKPNHRQPRLVRSCLASLQLVSRSPLHDSPCSWLIVQCSARLNQHSAPPQLQFPPGYSLYVFVRAPHRIISFSCR